MFLLLPEDAFKNFFQRTLVPDSVETAAHIERTVAVPELRLAPPESPACTDYLSPLPASILFPRPPPTIQPVRKSTFPCRS